MGESIWVFVFVFGMGMLCDVMWLFLIVCYERRGEERRGFRHAGL